jgi:hypothetical protein
MLTVSDGLGQRHTLLCDFVSLQAVSHGSLLSIVSHLHGQAATRLMDHTRVLHQLMDRFNVPAALLVLAGRRKLVSAS